MKVYKDLGIKSIINASDTYTRIGGSVMSETVLQAMTEASRCFVNIEQLSETVGDRIAKLTNNESALVSSGCAACIILVSAAAMCGCNIEKAKALPNTDGIQKNEFIVFKPQTEIDALPYWQLIKLSGAEVVPVEPTIDDLRVAITNKTAGIWLFAGEMYEEDTPDFKEVIDVARHLGVPTYIDAAAQLPPFSNLWYYTKQLGADGAVFSGGKYIMGPQSSGLFVGKSEISEFCRKISSPNVGIGRPFKVGKEEYIGFYQALLELSQINEETQRELHHSFLNIVEEGLHNLPIDISRTEYGRLGQEAPRLIIDLKTELGSDCAEYLYKTFDPGIDIGFYPPNDISGTPTQIFVNSINLKKGDAEYIVQCLKKYISIKMQIAVHQR